MKKFKSCASNVYAKELPNDLNEILTEKNGKVYYKNYRNKCSRGPNLEGKEAGTFSPSNGRWQIKYDEVSLLRSRVIWKIRTGKDPIGVIDHINENPLDDRYENLQDIPQGKNISYRYNER